MAPAAGGTFSSADIRSRDKIIEEKHQKELATLERKLARSNATNDDLMKQLYDAQHRGNRLATSLGFSDLYAAQVYIDNADDELSYKERSERVAQLQRELEACRKGSESPMGRSKTSQAGTETLKTDIEGLQSALDESRGEVQVLNERIEGYEAKVLELGTLQKRYDDIVTAMERAKERYTRDYRSMKQMHRWLKASDLGDAKLDSSLNGVKLARLRGFSKEDIDKLFLLLNEGMSLAALDKHLGIQIPTQHQRTIREPPKDPHSLIPPSSATRVASPQSSGKLHPSSPSPRANGLPHSSDTESDSQAIEPFNNSLFNVRQPRRLQAVLRHAGPSSDTEDDSQMPSRASLSPAPARVETPRCSSRPTVPQTAPHNSRRLQPGDLQRRPNTDLPRPGKVRRTIGEDISEQSDNTPVKAKHSDATTKRIPLQDRALVRETGNANVGDDSRPLPPLFKGKAKAENVVTPSSSAPSRKLTDYSVYKGRGRYAQQAGDAKPINALYTIDPLQNGGVDFQYNEVIRGKEARKKLHASDCECCRDYYDAIGPLPPRPQPPLWRSPESTPVKQRPKGLHDKRISPENSAATSVDRHRETISRHRQQWVRGRTPPGYWNIGFPSTQEANEINSRAEEMHRAKREQIETEAKRENGRYKRRDRDW